MLFNSVIFLLFIPIVFLVYWLLPARFRNLHLLISSYFFYFSYNPWFLLLLFGTSAFDFWCAKRIDASDNPGIKKFWLTSSVVTNIGVLFAFKYFVPIANYFIYEFNKAECVWDENTLFNNVIIPAGLSFYTFQSLSYTIDVYRGKYKCSDTLYEFLLYVSFFPHMVAGPIVRYSDLMPQFKVVQYLKKIDWESFIRLTIWGYFKKMVIADNLSKLVTPVFNYVESYNSIELLLAGFLFVVQVYCDFSGYSDIATGISKLFGINLSLNWRRPLLSKSLHEFWTRNHISITTWFRDYLYISLGGSRVSYVRWLINIFLVFLISGAWHGANLTFVVWGALHGVVYIIEILVSKKFPNFKAPTFAGWLYLIFFHTISLIAFRALNTEDLWHIYDKLFCSINLDNGISHLLAIADRLFFYICMALVILLFVKEYMEEHKRSDSFEKFKSSLRPFVYVLLLVLIFVLGDFNANEFIYFQF
ncbi:MAG: MBOAT family protein [Bacteroidia bacterium]|nr:MBOAT family protein [Bacteroidia bacterium]